MMLPARHKSMLPRTLRCTGGVRSGHKRRIGDVSAASGVPPIAPNFGAVRNAIFRENTGRAVSRLIKFDSDLNCYEEHRLN